MDYGKIAVIPCSGTLDLANEIASLLKLDISGTKSGRFADGEIHLQVGQVRGKDTYVIGRTNPPAENFQELILALQASKLASAHRITAVVPYFGYARQDTKRKRGEPISIEAFVRPICAYANRVILLDLHSPYTMGLFVAHGVVPDHLYSSYDLVPYFKERFKGEIERNELIVVSPDLGRAKTNHFYADQLGCDLAFCYKRRLKPNDVKHIKITVLGDVKGKVAILIDDMFDTLGTMIKASRALKKAGAKEIIIAGTHALFSGRAISRLNNSSISEVITTNSILIPQRKIDTLRKPITIRSIAPLFAKTIQCVNKSYSLSEKGLIIQDY